jgi:hypothetical protein
MASVRDYRDALTESHPRLVFASRGSLPKPGPRSCLCPIFPTFSFRQYVGPVTEIRDRGIDRLLRLVAAELLEPGQSTTGHQQHHTLPKELQSDDK